MISLLFWILIIACGFMFISLFIRLVIIIFLCILSILLWEAGTGGQAIVIILVLLYVFSGPKK